MKLPIKRSRSSRFISLFLSVGLMLIGIYLLLTTLSPMLAGNLIDPTNNETTKRLIATADNPITENRLFIPKIDINLPFRPGDASVMEGGAWWRVPENGNPRDGGNFVLSAHRFIMGWTPQMTQRKSPFYHIDKLAVGDEMTVDFDGKRYIYQITEIHRVSPDAIEIERRTDTPQLTLYSCTLGGASDGREVIVAKLKQ